MNIKKLLKFSVLSLFLALLAPTFAQAQQYTLVQTSTSAAITASQTQIRVASATGIYGYAPNLNQTPSNSATPQSALYIDREEIEVLSVNGTTLQVRRGINGTAGAAHASAAMVLAGPEIAFYTNDPGGTPASSGVGGGSCTLANTLVTPWLNVRNGYQWLCSSVTGTWIRDGNPTPSFRQPRWLRPLRMCSPTGPLFHVTGTTHGDHRLYDPRGL